MIIGIESFKKKFEGMDGQYTIIGGTACDLLMSEMGENFRATKDIDIVLIIEGLTAEFGKRFWEYVKEAGYEHKNKSTGDAQFYRFYRPISSDYPFMIEVFSRKPDDFILPDDAVLTPLPFDEGLSSLSAILLNDNYYEFIRNGIVKVEGVAVLDALHLIPLKAKAWLDLSEKKSTNNDSVDSRDVKKHKNDIYRLASILTPMMQIRVPEEIYNDIQHFIADIKNDGINLKQLDISGLNKEDIITILNNAYLKQD